MSIAYEIDRLKLNKQQVKEQVNVDKDIIYEGREFIRGETVRHYPSGIKSMEMSYKDFIPVHTSTESLIETERGGTIIKRHLMGNTIQNGTPTPSSPVAIQSVTGLQNFSICGKNLYDKNNVTSTGASNQNIKFTTTLLPNTQYTFNITSNRTWGTIYLYDSSNTQTRTIGNYSDANKLTFTTSASEVKGDFIFKEDTNVDVSTYDFTGVQLEKGSTATPYEPYQGKDYEINLGKNLANLNKLFNNTDYYSITNNELSVLALDGRAWTDLGDNWGLYLKKGSYILSTSKGGSINTQIQGQALGQIIRANMNNGKITFTLSQDDLIGVKFLQISTLPQEIGTIQIEQGSVATSYSPYFEPIELNKIGDYQDFIRKGTGKNLFNKNAQVYKSNYYIDGSGQEGTTTEFSIFKTYLEPNTTYTITNSGASGTPGYALFNSSDERVGGSNYSNRSHITFTTTNDTSYMLESVVVNASSTRYDLNIFQIEQGSIATYYEPYNYGDKWYIEKNTGRVVLDSNCDVANFQAGTTSGVYRFAVGVTGIDSIGIDDAGTDSPLFCNILKPTNRDKTYAKVESMCYGMATNTAYKNFIIYTDETKNYDVATFKTWLGTKKPVVYYVLSSPTFETISDSTLISQLNENIYLLEGQNNISVSGNLPTGIDVDYIERVNKHLIGNTNESAE